MDESEERAYLNGERMAWLAMLDTCIRALGHDNAPGQSARWIRERAEVRAALRVLCKDFGDNDWPDNLHLGDVIEKHLARHLYTQKDAP